MERNKIYRNNGWGVVIIKEGMDMGDILTKIGVQWVEISHGN